MGTAGRLGFAWFKPSGLFGWLIVARTATFRKDGRFSHVEVYDPSRSIVDATGVTQYWCFSAYEGDGGVRGKFIPLDKIGATRLERWVDSDKLAAAWEFALSQDGKRYGWREIRGFIFPWRNGKPDEWICSELCTVIAQKAGLVDPAVRAERVSPRGLWLLLMAAK